LVVVAGYLILLIKAVWEATQTYGVIAVLKGAENPWPISSQGSL